MTPQEKANQLILKYFPEIQATDKYNMNLNSHNANTAAKCALIAVNQILETEPRYPSDVDLKNHESYDDFYEEQRKQADNFWYDVRHHLQSLR